MTRTVNVTLTGLARGGELVTVVSLSEIRPRCIEYALACVTVEIDGCQVSCQAQGVTETTALASIARWLVRTFGAKSASIGHRSLHELLDAA
jgi:hypothetical protein